MPLTDTTVKNVKPKSKSSKLFDGGGLYLEVSPKGGKWWRFKYRFGGKEKLISLGVYPDVKLKSAREKRNDMRKLLTEGKDPSLIRKLEKVAQQIRAANNFEDVAREWLAYRAKEKEFVPAHTERVLRRLTVNVFPWIGGRPIAEITPIEILTCVKRIEARGANATARRALQNCGQILRYAVAHQKAERDCTRDISDAIESKKVKHFAAVTDPKRAGELLREIDSYSGTFVVKSALQLAPLVFVRPGELRKAKWSDIDLSSALWSFWVTKTESDHIVPLSKQAVKILTELFSLTGSGQFVFPSARSYARPMSDGAVLAALRRLGIPKEEMSGHGFRAMARTILDEVHEFPIHIIEHQLAHTVRDANGRAYNRTAHLPQRTEMMQAWADYLDELKLENATRARTSQ